MAELLCDCYYTLHNTHYTNTRSLSLPDPSSFFFSPLVTSSFFLRHPPFFCAFMLSTSVSFFPLCEKPHSNPFPSFLLLPFCSLALPPFTSDISQMAYSNWNLPFCQDKKTSLSPKHYTIELKFDSLLRLLRSLAWKRQIRLSSYDPVWLCVRVSKAATQLYLQY